MSRWFYPMLLVHLREINHDKGGYMYARWLVPVLLGLVMCSGASAVTHVIYFGGNYTPVYNPSSTTVAVGDTISWRGDFDRHPFCFVSVPAGAATATIPSGDQIDYVVTTVGTYRYQSNLPHSLAMVGSFVATSKLRP
jgi:plastocyanin